MWHCKSKLKTIDVTYPYTGSCDDILILKTYRAVKGSLFHSNHDSQAHFHSNHKSRILFCQTILQITLSQVCSPVSTCDYLRLGLARPLSYALAGAEVITNNPYWLLLKVFFPLNILCFYFPRGELVCRLAVTLLQH